VATAAFDHEAGTFWRSDQSTGAWLQVDLGSNHLLDALVVDWAPDMDATGPVAQSTVMTSLDGLQWSYLYTLGHVPEYSGVPRQVWFPQRVARYVRFTGTKWHEGGALVRSLEFYGPECPLEPAPSDKQGVDVSDIEF
jgi:hypothetical protein